MHTKEGYDYLTATRTIHNKKCRLKLIIVTPDGSNASYVDVYNGKGTNDPQVARLRAPTTQSVLFPFGENFVLERGLHIVFGTNLSSATVISEPVE